MSAQTVVWCPDCKAQHVWGRCPLAGLCLTCKTRPAMLHFGDALSFTHGGGLNCCELCSAEKQLAHARECAARLPELERLVAALSSEDATRPTGDRE